MDFLLRVDSFVIKNFILMKKYFVLCVVIFAFCAGTSFAQMNINNPLAQKKPLLQIPMVHITPVSSRFVPVHIDTIKPFVVSLKPIVYGNQESAVCAELKKLKQTLVLNAERANDITATLQWETKYAFFATGFNIERSFGDSLHFSTINFATPSKGTAFKKNYHLPDHNDYSGLSFYRIKQRNGDTGFLYSNIVAIKGVETLPFRIYPNPASNKLWVDVAPKQSGNFAIMVYDPAGKIIQQLSASCTRDVHAVESINVGNLAAGLYQVKVLFPDKTFLTAKFVKK
jgi:hypothetical protein